MKKLAEYSAISERSYRHGIENEVVEVLFLPSAARRARLIAVTELLMRGVNYFGRGCV